VALELGLWVQCEGEAKVFQSRASLDQLLERLRPSAIDTVYLQVYRGNRAYYASAREERGPWYGTEPIEGEDPLQYLLGRLHGLGKKVFAWINVYSLARRERYRIVDLLGEGVIARDNYARSLLVYPSLQDGLPVEENAFWLDTPVHWLDPGDLRVRAYHQEVLLELIHRYPTFDGVHLDFIRYPYAVPMAPGSRFSPRLDFGYNEQSLERFGASTGKRAPLQESEDFFSRCWRWISTLFGEEPSREPVSGNAWDEWRRLQITNTVAEYHAILAQYSDRMTLSAAVLSWPDRAYLSAMQDWRGWLEDGLLEEAVIMNYTLDDRHAGQLTRQAQSFARGRSEVAIGLGAYLFRKDPRALRRQVRRVVACRRWFPWRTSPCISPGISTPSLSLGTTYQVFVVAVDSASNQNAFPGIGKHP